MGSFGALLSLSLTPEVQPLCGLERKGFCIAEAVLRGGVAVAVSNKNSAFYLGVGRPQIQCVTESNI